MKFLIGITSAVLCAQGVLGAATAPFGAAIEARAPASPQFPTLTNWVESHLRAVFNVKQTYAELNNTIDATYAANASLTFSGVVVPNAFLKSNINSQLRQATLIKMDFSDVIQLNAKAGDESAGIVAGYVVLNREHGRQPTTKTASVFILQVAQDPTVKGGKNVDKRRIVDSHTVIVSI